MFDHLSEGRWWDIGLDLVTGCTPVSAGCDNCWSAERAHRAGCQKNPRMRARYGGLTDATGHWTGEVRPQWQDLDKIGRARKPQVYTFWNDLFHPVVPDDFVDAIMDKIHENIWRQKTRTGNHFFTICTKRQERALIYFSSRQHIHGFKNWQNRLMLMTTIENQEMADLRLPILLQIPGVLHGVSYEPALGPVDFSKFFRQPWICEFCFRFDYQNHLPGGWDFVLQSAVCPDCIKRVAEDGGYGVVPGGKYAMAPDPRPWKSPIHWIIPGGETGSHARPMHPDCVRQARDQAVAAGVPFFFKSWGEWLPFGQSYNVCEDKRYKAHKMRQVFTQSMRNGREWNEAINRVGKKAAGRILDGRTWDEVPKVIR